jgi:Na+/serine symporter
MSGTWLNPRKRIIVYSIVAVVMGAGVVGYVFATGLVGYFAPNPGEQPPILLTLINTTISSDQNQQNATVATIWLRNLGTTTGTITTLVIRWTCDSCTVLYSAQTNVTIGPRGGVAEVVVDTLGSGFHFSHGGYYYFTITDNAGGQMGFHVSY